MAGLFQRLFGRSAAPAEVKESSVGPLIAATVVGRPVWPQRDFAQAAREGYQRNPIVFRCVRAISQAVASIPLDIVSRDGQNDGNEVDAPELAALLNQPNPMMDGETFREALVAYFVLAGNAYIERVDLMRKPKELWLWRPDRVRVIPGPNGMPKAYEFTANGGKRDVPIDSNRAEAMTVLHWRDFNPLDDWYGMPAIDPAAFAVDAYTAASAWNKALLDNGARPSGALVYQPKEGPGRLSTEQFNALKQQLEQGYSGAANSGKPLLLEGGMTWQEMSLSPQDMDFANGKDAAARDIARAYGVPPMVLGIPGDNTYSNYAEANKAFYRETIIPLAQKMCRLLSQWLCPAFGQNLAFEPDLDDLYVFADERATKVQAIEASTTLTTNEKREEAWGLDPVDGGDTILVSATMVPLDAAATAPATGAEDDEDPQSEDGTVEAGDA